MRELAAAAQPLAPVRTKSLPDDVYDALLDMLTWGTLQPGASLSIDGLSQSLGVSPTPVREALARLESTGLVRRTARRGYRVSPPMSQEQMAELADARLVLETGAMERAMRHSDDLQSELEVTFKNHERSARVLLEPGEHQKHENLRKYFEDDWSFHEVILQNCGNRYIAQAVDALSFRVHRMRQTVGLGATDAPVAVSEHRAILDAVRAHDTAAAVEKMRIHLTNLESRVADGGPTAS